MRKTALDRPADSLSSHLFTVRLWSHDLGDGRVEWRGKVQHVLSGETRYFREWSILLDFLRSALEPEKKKHAMKG